MRCGDKSNQKSAIYGIWLSLFILFDEPEASLRFIFYFFFVIYFFVQSYIKTNVSTKFYHYTAGIASEKHHWRKTAFSFMETSKRTEPSACVIA